MNNSQIRNTRLSFLLKHIKENEKPDFDILASLMNAQGIVKKKVPWLSLELRNLWRWYQKKKRIEERKTLDKVAVMGQSRTNL